MAEGYEKLLRSRLKGVNFKKLMELKNPMLHQFVAEAVELCNPDSVFVCTDSDRDLRSTRKLALESKEEKPLGTRGHTIHFDGYNDQGRDKGSTKYLLPPGVTLGQHINSTDREAGLAEVRGLLKDCMAGRTMIVRFLSLGPTNSEFSISGVQVTDSAYVAHCEDLLYRAGYEQFKRIGDAPGFFRVIHSCGQVDEDMVSVNPDKRRVYIDLEEGIVYSANTQYAGNTVGFKKLSLRLAIRKADAEKWLAEHMFVMGAHGPKGRVTYFTGAFPSYCGKTSTAMIPGETIIGDDLAYLRRMDGEVRAVNVESGIFGIIQGVNATDDPAIWKVITKPGEVIFSNVLIGDGIPYWTGDGREHPNKGTNFSGDWYEGKKDAEGQDIPPSHPNARYTLRLKDLDNLDPRAEDPKGVVVGGVIYGGRDVDTNLPLQEAFDWEHGVITMGASLESQTTAAVIGKVGVRSFQPMSNIDFVSIPLGRYIQNHLDFVKGIAKPPIIFGVNYFICEMIPKKDKYVWIKWMELRANGDVGCIRIPTGCIPRYEDLKPLFKQVIDFDYTEAQYAEQFKLRVVENIAKIDRIENIYRTQVADTPQRLFEVLAAQRRRLTDAQTVHGDYISPLVFAKQTR